MRILELISALGINGVSKHALDLGLGLRRCGHEVVYLGRPNSWVIEAARSHQFETLESDLHRWPDDELRRVAKLVREHKIDLVHTHMSKAHFFGVLLKWYSGIPTVATAHSCHLQLHWMANDFVIAVSEATRRYHCRINWVANRRIETIHNFIQFSEIDEVARQQLRGKVRSSLHLEPTDFVLGVVGRIAPQKGQQCMIEAMPAIVAREPHAKLVFIGGFETPEYLVEIERRIDKLQLKDRVQFLGLRTDVLDLYRGMDLLIQPSLWESFPISMLEGMAAGVPIVASDVGGVCECIEHERSGYLVPANKPEPLASAIVGLAHTPAKRERLATEAKRVVRSRFTAESQIPRIMRVFEGVSAKRRHRRAA